MIARLALISTVVLALAGAAGAAVQKGDTELEFLAGILSESGPSDGADLDSWFVSSSLDYFVSDNLSLGIGGFGSEIDLKGTTSTISVDVGGGTSLDARFSDVEQDVTLWGLGGNIKLHFAPANRWVPYIGGQIKWVSAKVDTTGKYAGETAPGSGVFAPDPPADFSSSTDTNGVLYGPLAGVRVELNEYNDLFVEAQYHVWGGDIGDLLDNGFGIFVGIVHQFQ
jgi:hypothetical protein